MNSRPLTAIYPKKRTDFLLKHRPDLAGFTLVEMLIAMTVSGVLFAGIAQVLINQRDGYVTRHQVVAMHQQSRDAMGFMARELTMAGYDPTGCTCVGIVVATANTLQVTQDLNGDGDAGDANENITYVLYDDGGDGDQDLGRDTDGPGGVAPMLVAENVETLTFAYTLADGTTTAAPADLTQVRTIDMTLIARTAQPDAQYEMNGGYRTHQLTETVQLRNLGL